MEEDLKNDDAVKVVKIHDHRILTAKLQVYDWMSDIALENETSDFVEVRFKNTRKGFYHNHAKLPLQAGEIVAVEASPGHDIGIVSLTGELVKEHMKKYNVRKDTDLKKVYRKAKPHDIEKWEDAISLEHETMIKSRKLSEELNLNMKIGDVEYQGDKTKAIFYYIAEERVDFRQLIKVLAETFRIRIEMKQIGARQEAGRIGGIGPCGRELCCSSFITNFVSVTTSAARYQDISLNPQKLAGQCSKLKCCLNYEVDNYIDTQKSFPSTHVELKTEEGNLKCIKTDILAKTMTYILHKDGMDKFICLSTDRVKFIQAQNRKNKIVKKALVDEVEPEKKSDYENVVGQDSLHRFDDDEPRKNKSKRNIRNKKRLNKGTKLNTESDQLADSDSSVDSTKQATDSSSSVVSAPKAANDEKNIAPRKQIRRVKKVVTPNADKTATPKSSVSDANTESKKLDTPDSTSSAESGDNAQKPNNRAKHRRYNNRKINNKPKE